MNVHEQPLCIFKAAYQDATSSQNLLPNIKQGITWLEGLAKRRRTPEFDLRI